jgi:hypothetical protein
MQVAKDRILDGLSANSRSKIPTFSRALSFPVRGSLILDGGDVYVGTGTAWIPVGGGVPPVVTISGSNVPVAQIPQVAPGSDYSYIPASASYYYTTVDDVNNGTQIHTLRFTMGFLTTNTHVTGQDALFAFPAGTLPYTSAPRSILGITYSNTVTGSFGCDLQLLSDGSCLVGAQQIATNATYVTSNSFTWAV